MRARRSRSEWAALVAEFEGSGESLEQFAIRRDLNANTLKWWRSRLRNQLTLVAVPLDEPDDPMLVVEVSEEITVQVPASAATRRLGRFVGAVAKEFYR